ncbi:amino acid adenylation domain-containing protein [Chitinophaga oryzae]|uniref:Amino acid adenylation domain-containing protein n=1 Tax=Chitinophaga oryzae TaxID=2725414 RepID=A0AAE7D7Y7_9BACT|nr:non-ribosomal peptide synthetase [Chitinophaga oryzae]QJB32852.1 amino acid adenylation domain-containing protein [Chitinophaga oryzae]
MSVVHTTVPLNELPPAFSSLCQSGEMKRHTWYVAAISLLLSRYSGEQVVVVNVPLFKPERLQKIYCELLPVVVPMERGGSLRAYLNQIKDILGASYEHQNYPLELITGDEKTPSFSNVLVTTGKIDEARIGTHDLCCCMDVSDGVFVSSCYYRKGLFEQAFIERIGRHILNIAVCLSNPDISLNDIRIMDEQEEEVLKSLGAGIRQEIPEGSIIACFKQMALERPDAVAVTFGDGNLSYGALYRRSALLACQLREIYDVRPGQLLGVYLERSVDWLVAMLGVTMSGAAYLPINPAYPAERTAAILEDSQLKLILTHSGFLFDFPGFDGSIFAVDIEFQPEETETVQGVPAIPAPGSLAYVIYTSGSTGRPKGVAVEHKGLVNMVGHQISQIGINSSDNVLQFSPLTFDASVYEVWIALLAGARLTLIQNSEVEDIDRLKRTLFTRNVTTIVMPPSYLKLFEKDTLRTVNKVISAGERADISDAAFYRKFKKYINAYGPTETTVCASIYQDDGFFNGSEVPIGKPVRNMNIYILDSHHRLQPLGTVGEIAVSGPGVARGYINNPELTAERFLPSLYDSRFPVYLTGDLGRWTEGGQLLFAGRKDDQIKINGNRIEPGEIEQVLLSFPGIGNAAVCRATDEGMDMLVAFVVAESGAAGIIPEALAAFAAARLPRHLLPSAYEITEKIPLNINGKADRKKLLAAFKERRDIAPVIAPANKQEEMVAAVYEQILGVTGISVEQNFFHLGGNSLKGIRLITELSKMFAVRLELPDVFNYPTVATMARFLSGYVHDPADALLPVEDADTYPLSFAQQSLWLTYQLNPAAVNYNIAVARTLKGNLNISCLQEAFQAVVEKYEILRTVFPVVNGTARQRVLPAGSKYEVVQYDASSRGPGEINELVNREINIPFNLEEGPPVRCVLIRMSATEHILILSIHHIIADGRSMAILNDEINRAYFRLLNRQDAIQEQLPVQFRDYVYWKLNQDRGRGASSNEVFWQQTLTQLPPALRLPFDYERRPVHTAQGATANYVIAAPVAGALQAFSIQQHISLFNSVLGAVHLFLSRLCRQERVITGIPVSGRTQAELVNQIGFFVNVLPVLSHIRPTDSFVDVTRQISHTLAAVYSHAEYPLDAIVEKNVKRREPGRHPLIDVVVSCDMNDDYLTAAETSGTGEVEALDYEVELEVSDYDLELNFVESSAGAIALSIRYNNLLFKRSTVDQIFSGLNKFIGHITAYPAEAIEMVDLGPEAAAITNLSLEQHFRLDEAF